MHSKFRIKNFLATSTLAVTDMFSTILLNYCNTKQQKKRCLRKI